MLADGAAAGMTAPTVELLYWDGCPSWPRALAELRDELTAVGLDADAVAVREIVTDTEAQANRFVGSPTLRIDGAEVAPVPDEPAGLTCRVYRTRDGRISPVPDRVDVREALERAIERRRS
jgi:hypothetical protein